VAEPEPHVPGVGAVGGMPEVVKQPVAPLAIVQLTFWLFE